jgi:hypothetical protein
MDRKSKRTVISIEDEPQQQLDFEEAAHLLPFTFPEYQRELISARIVAGLADFAIIGAVYLVFLLLTFTELPEGFSLDGGVVGF